jgi:hypothetical protein
LNRPWCWSARMQAMSGTQDQQLSRGALVALASGAIVV